jgi:hypothetical protein
MIKWATLSLAAIVFAQVALGEDKPKLFKKIQLTDQFLAEGATFGDFNKDGHMDVAVGPYWWEGPDFTKRHQFAFEPEMAPAKPLDPHGYSNDFLMFTGDFNNDGWPDILVVGFPGKETYWYENPQGRDEPWKQHLALKQTDNESPTFGDLLGNGHPVLICMTNHQMGYAQPDEKDPTAPWIWHPTSPTIPAYQRFTHGIGFGDVNGDGRMDLLDKDGWYEQPADLKGDPIWKKHPFHFANNASQMYVYDVNGDGLPDVICALEAHKYGLAWYEQKRMADGEITFVQHLIAGSKPSDSPYGVVFSEPHAIALADMDGDGLLDIVTGKRWWAHGPGKTDPDSDGTPVLYFFKLVRSKAADGSTLVDWVPYLIDDASGVGTQVTVGKIAGGPLPDVLVGNKRGAFVFINQMDKLGPSAVREAAPKPKPIAAPDSTP